MKNKARFQVLCVLLLYANNFLYCGDEIFSTSPTNRLRNMYAIVQNKFDSATSHFSVGEFQLLRSGIKTDIPFVKSNFQSEDQLGASATGLDSILSNKFKTSSFTPSTGDTVGFYMESLVTTTDCPNVNESGDPSPPGGIGPAPGDWKTWVHAIKDITKVVIRIENVANPSVGVNLDSVVIPSNPLSKWVLHSGMSMDDYNHKIAIPSAMNGVNSRIRLLIYRNGPTPNGAIGAWEFADIAYSAYRCPWSVSKLTDTQTDSLMERYKTVAENYMRSSLSVSNSFENFAHLNFDDTTELRIMSDYFRIVQDTNDTTINRYYPLDYTKDLGAYGSETFVTTAEYEYTFPKKGVKSSNKTEVQTQEIRQNEGISLLGVNVNPIDGFVRIKVDLPRWVKDLTWSITDLLGREVDSGVIWPGFTGEGNIHVPLYSGFNQVYFLRIADNQRGTAFTVKLVH